MLIITIHLKLALEDAQCGKQVADFVADKLRDFCLDKLDAEVARTPLVEERHVDYPDFSTQEDWDVLPTDGSPDPIEVWQTRAEQEMQA